MKMTTFAPIAQSSHPFGGFPVMRSSYHKDVLPIDKKFFYSIKRIGLMVFRESNEKKLDETILL